MPNLVKFGSTSNLVRFTLKSKSTGQGLTGLSITTAGLVISTICDNEATAVAYTQAGGTLQTIATLGTYAAPSASNCRFKEVDNVNHKGLYEFQFADARFAVASSKRLVISVNDAEATILDADYEILLTQFDPFDGVRLGLTALPNAAANAAGGLPVSIAGALDLDEMNADIEAIQTGVAAIPTNPYTGTPPTVAQIATAIFTDLMAGSDFGTAGSFGALVKADINAPIGSIPTAPLLAANVPANFAALLISVGGHVSNVDTLTTYTGNTPQTGDAYARVGVAGAGLTVLGDTRIANLDATVSSRMATYTQPTGFLAATFPTTLASPTNITAGTITTVTTLTNLPAVPTDWLTAAGVKADAVTKIQAGLATPTNITAGVITTVTNLTNAPTAGDLTAAMKTSVQASVDAAITANATVVEIGADVDELIVSVAAIPTGAPPTTAAITAAVWSFLFDTLYTAEQYLKAAGAAAGGSSHLVTPTAVSFKSLDGAETYVASAVDAVGNRNNSYPNL